MDVTQSYELWFNSADGGVHDIRAAANAQLLGRLAETATNRRVAEYFLRLLDYAGQNQRKVQQFKVQNHETVNTRTLDYITYIHQHCKDDIESRWGAYLSDEEVNEILFKEELLRELVKIKPKSANIEIGI